MNLVKITNLKTQNDAYMPMALSIQISLIPTESHFTLTKVTHCTVYCLCALIMSVVRLMYTVIRF